MARYFRHPFSGCGRIKFGFPSNEIAAEKVGQQAGRKKKGIQQLSSLYEKVWRRDEYGSDFFSVRQCS